MKWTVSTAVLICSTAFTYYFVLLVSRYLKYETLTQATELPNIETGIEDTLCASIEKLSKVGTTFQALMGREQAINNLTKNGQYVQLEHPYIWNNIYQCWHLKYTRLENEEDDYFQLYSFIDLNLQSWIMRFLIGKSLNDIPNQRYPLEAGRWKRVVRTHLVMSLALPYDTECHSYDNPNVTSQSACIVNCSNTTVCRRECSRQDCTKLIFEDHFRESQESNSIGIYFSNRFNLKFQSHPRFTSTTFLLQTVGLLAMFYEVALISLVVPTRSAIKKAHDRLIKLLFKKMMGVKEARRSYNRRKLRWKRFKKLLTFLVLLGFLVHVSLTTSCYFQYNTLSETFIGSPTKKYSPSLSVCFNHEQSDDVRPILIATKIRADRLFQADLPNVVKTFFQRHDICFMTTFSQSSFDVLGVIHFKRLGMLLDVKFYISPNNSLPRNSRPLWASTGLQNLFFTHLLEYTSLPSPFDSNCFDYHQIGLESQSYCFDHCLIRNYTLHYGMFPPNTINHRHWRIASSPDTPSRDLTAFCHNLCSRNDCESLQFSVISRMVKVSQAGSIYVKSPVEGVLIKLLPQLQLVDYITYTATTFGFWLGVSCMGLLLKVFKLVNLVSLIPECKPKIKVLVWMVLLPGLTYHMYQLIDDYLKYAIVSIISMNIPKSVGLPSLSLVFALNNQTARRPIGRETLNQTWSPKEYNRNFVAVDEMLKEVQLIDPKTRVWMVLKQKNLTALFLHTREYVAQSAKVLTIDFSSFQPTPYDAVDVRDEESFVRISFNPRISKERSLYHLILHSGLYYDIGVDEPAFDPKGETMTYDLTVTKLLPAPYASDCKDRPSPIEGKKTWFKCIIESYPNGSLPYELSLPVSYSGRRVYTSSEIIRRKCIEKYKSKPSCVSVHYRTETEKKLAIDYEWDIVVQVPDEEVLCQFMAKTTLLDLIIFLLDATGIWLGLNVYSFVKKLISPIRVVE